MGKAKRNKKNRAPPRPFSGDRGVVSGFIFFCDGRTKPECFQNRVFGLSMAKLRSVKRIARGATLFLFDCEMKLLYGVYRATSNGGENLVPAAFGGRFPAQVHFQIESDCLPLTESVFRHCIKENYSKGKFRPELNSEQVDRLLALFQAITLPYQPQPPVDQRYTCQNVPSSSMHYAMPPAAVDPRHLSAPAPPPPPPQHYHPAPPPLSDQYYYSAPPNHPYHQGRFEQIYSPGNPVPSQCADCRPVYEPQYPVPFSFLCSHEVAAQPSNPC